METIDFLKMMMSSQPKSDNYTQLLQEFNIHEKEISIHQQFAELIDDIRIQKMNKNSLIKRKIQQRNKLIHLNLLWASKSNHKSAPKLHQQKTMRDQDFMVNELQQSVLKKQIEQLTQSTIELKKNINQTQSQLQVFKKKDNDIQQLLYSSRRELEAVHNDLRNQRIIIARMQEKHQRQLENLQMMKKNTERQNRFLADLCGEKKKNVTYLLQGTFSLGLNYNEMKPNVTLQEIYTKRQVEHKLRVLYLISCCKNLWNGSVFGKEIKQIYEESQKNIKSVQLFRFFSKNEIMNEYQGKLSVKNFEVIGKKIIQFYNNIRSNINRNEKVANQLNAVCHQLKNEYEQLQQAMADIEKNKQKNVLMALSQLQENNMEVKSKVRQKNQTIFKYLNKKLNCFQRFRRVIETLNSIIEGKNKRSIESLMSSSFRKFNSHRRKSAMEKKQTNNQLLKKNSNLLFASQSMEDSKGFNHSFTDKRYLLENFEHVMLRSLQEIIVEWYENIKNGEQGANFMETILTNDLYRIFCSPHDYSPDSDQVSNEQRCYLKAFSLTNDILGLLKQKIIEKVSQILAQTANLQQKQKQQPEQNEVNMENESLKQKKIGEQMKYVVESKGYFRRDDFKLLQKLERIQLKRKGLYIPYKYGVDIEEQLIPIKKLVKRPQKFENSLDARRRLTTKNGERSQRISTPLAHNYLSSYREKLNKADRKIRDLIKNAQNLKSEKKSYRLSVRTRRKDRNSASFLQMKSTID